ncbi:CU044_5270 family protein [Kutzneria sp. CA-103260]|uniref:CU044_5270 family protein n=1 Tax=Kutzneria sp. CA-103260 TaxID=2802641 RepID=UPI001BAC7610|nr:CU044_5270 family protein [Kutzneria sp. CA-103260]QUQ69613.1 hypothetical protein JJ691_73730 [Kutzneria sp. CA-103260]
MRQLWTDDELDQALAELHADVQPTPNGLAKVRDRVLNPAPARGPRFRSPWFPVIAVAAAMTLVTGMLVVLPRTLQTGAPPTAASGAQLPQKELNALLAKIHYSDPTIAHGQFRYTRYQAWAGSSPDGLLDQVTMTWQPTVWTDDWLRHISLIGTLPVKYADGAIKAVGPEQKVVGPATQVAAEQDFTAGCGNFDAVTAIPPASDPCAQQKGDWPSPTPEWLASLPKDPKQLLTTLYKVSRSSVIDNAVYALRTGVVPADVRAALYRALAEAPGSYGREDVPNLQGKRGLAIGVIQDDVCDELLIDPSDGSFLGGRQFNQFTGAVISFSAMAYGVVDQRRVTPTK